MNHRKHLAIGLQIRRLKRGQKRRVRRNPTGKRPDGDLRPRVRAHLKKHRLPDIDGNAGVQTRLNRLSVRHPKRHHAILHLRHIALKHIANRQL